MNKTAIKNFAIWARNKLIADISYRAGLIGITESGIASALPQSTGTTEFYDIGTAEPYSISGDAVRQRRRLVELIERKEKETDYKTAYKYIIEEVAYTWFNRLIAIRFMEINDYLPSHIRVLSSESGKLEPDLVTNPFDADLEFSQAEDSQIMKLKQDNQLDELFRMLFIKQCNSLNEILPVLFEKTNDYTELLLNVSVIDKDGVVYHLVNDIPEEDFDVERGGQVEIIGWLYQYYNIEPKNAAFAKKGKIAKEEIPAVTQLFTPDWIVRYMVENSLGRLWLEGHQNTELKENWKYYLDAPEQEYEVQVKLDRIREEYEKLNPEDIKIIDPCMGSGHILVYAFDVLMQIYESAGYSQRDAVISILENNIYGLDIDDRAYQLSYFSLMMKARQYNRRVLNGKNTCFVYSIQESNGINRKHIKYYGADLSEKEKKLAEKQLNSLLDTFIDAKEYGSILSVVEYDWDLLRRYISKTDEDEQISFETYDLQETTEKLHTLINIGSIMANRYWVTCTNPPYAGTSNLSEKVNRFVKNNYPDSKSDLFAVFIEACGQMTKKSGFQAMITQHAWMFLSSFEKLREKINLNDIVSMAHLGARAFDEISGEVVQTTTFVLRKSCSNCRGIYCRLVEPTSQLGKEKMFLSEENRYITVQSNFSSIPGSPVSYWVSDKMLRPYGGQQKLLGEIAAPCAGLATGDNNIFQRLWYEVEFGNIGFGVNDIAETNSRMEKWYPCNSGGEFRKWSTDDTYVVYWQNDGFEIRQFRNAAGKLAARPQNTQKYFKEGLTWNKLSTSRFAVKYKSAGYIFDDTSRSAFPTNKNDLMYYIGLLCSCVTFSYLQALNPTMSFTNGDLVRIPVIKSEDYFDIVTKLVKENIMLSKDDWDSFETSWDFKTHPLVALRMNGAYVWGDDTPTMRLSSVYKSWEMICEGRFCKLKENEERLNNIFISIYDLQEELKSDVEDKDVTVRKADLRRDIKSLISYAVGCMFGRYSLDNEGLSYAGGNWIGSKYETFIPDVDNCIPITDEEYFEDDIVGLFCVWMKKVYGEDTLEENLDFIAKALGNKGTTSRDVIRNYFSSDFIKEHIKIYQKHPIYWLFDSGKQNGFKALVYMHRWNADTIGNLRVDYLHRMQRTYESEINRMQDTIDHSTNAREVAAATKRKEKLQKQLKECREYDEKIGHLALSRIDIDLDDGVKMNYEKVQTASDGKKYQVLAKI